MVVRALRKTGRAGERVIVNHELTELFGEFVSESDERLARIEELLLTLEEFPQGVRTSDLDSLRRELHTLKGNSGMMGLDELQALAHAMEDRVDAMDPEAPEPAALFADLDRFRSLLRAAEAARDGDTPTATADSQQGARAGTIRVSLNKLNDLIDLSTELLGARTRLETSISRGLAAASEAGDASGPLWKRLGQTRNDLEKTLDALHRAIQNLRMVPLQPVFGALKRIVHDESRRSGKQVRLVTRGEKTPLDNSLLELAGETLGHMVRNAVVHGIERPSEREAAGKPPVGQIRVSASVKAGSVWIEVRDDGAGIDRQALVEAAREAGHDVGPDTDLHDLVFQSGLSSRSETDRSAGRGMGMSAVLDAARRYGGLIDVETVAGRGALFRLQLPLTVAATEALLVEVGGEEYAIPAAAVLETAAPTTGDCERGFLELDDFEVPLVDLAENLTHGAASTENTGVSRDRYAIVLAVTGRTRALLVDEVLDLREIVVHRLDAALEHLPALAGTTVLGDGRVVLILDPEALVAMRSVGESAGAVS